MKSLIIESAEGAETEITKEDYIKYAIDAYNVKESTGGNGVILSPKKKVQYIVDTLLKEDKALEDEFVSENQELVTQITADIQRTKNSLGNAAEQKKAEAEQKRLAKEAEDAKKKEELALLNEKQGTFENAAIAGMDGARDSLLKQMSLVKESLPEGIQIVQDSASGGFGISLTADVTPELLGRGLGHLVAVAQGNQFMSEQLQFLSGDIVNSTVAAGYYRSSSEASAALSKALEAAGKHMAMNSLRGYARMAADNPLSYRNPEAQPTAYLEITRVPDIKKGEGETEEQFKARKEKLDNGLNEVRASLRDGKIRKRDEALKAIQEVKYQTGLADRPAENEERVSIGALLKQFFLFTKAKEKLEGLHEKNKIVLSSGGKPIAFDIDDINSQLTEVETQLENALFTVKDTKPKDFFRGYTSVMKPTVIGEDGEGKPITEDRPEKVSVYYPIFFKYEEDLKPGDKTEDGEASETGSEESAPAESAPEATSKPAAKKAAKKAANA